MNPLITSASALREMASGLATSAIESTPRLFFVRYASSDVLLTTEDDAESPTIVIWREDFTRDPFVPNHLVESRREVLSRMASFAERAQLTPISLPRAWHQFKRSNLVSFFAVPRGDALATRWIAEHVSGNGGATVFWRATTAKNKTELEDFEAEALRLPGSIFDDQANALQELEARKSSQRDEADAEVYLPHRPVQDIRDHTFEGWLASASPDQLSFVNASTDRSIRLRGPAGSGKTLALTLKAVREVLNARSVGDQTRVLVVTHSWPLATQISNNIDMLGLGKLPEIETFPLLEIAEALAPRSVPDGDLYTVVGDDSFSGKQAQLDELLEILTDFVTTDWVTYRAGASASLRTRLDSSEPEQQLAMAWDLLIEFGSVIGAAGIFPGAGAEARYSQMPRSSWMLPLVGPGDHRVIFRIYERYMRSLEERHLVTTDQVLADFLGYLVSHAWNRGRKTLGYDLVFVDEFHLFSPLERQAIHYLTRDVSHYPRIFMALDPRQSPSEVYIGAASDDTQSGVVGVSDEDLGDVRNLELSSVHRFTPQILDLVKHIHHEFPTLSLGDDWAIDFSTVTSTKSDGAVPLLTHSGTQNAEENDIVRAIHDSYQNGRLALAIVDTKLWPRYSQLASTLAASGKFHVSVISARADIEDVGYRKKGIVVGAAEHLAGLQFETVLVAGLPSMHEGSPPYEQRRLLSLLYLAVSRAESEVRLFANDDNGGVAEVLRRAVEKGHLRQVRGSLA